ncbi:hypothetical protein [Aneurinibacillus tyrosinisolvens]|uniref:hypothetical protein n=1 Tax=Aneurinibacillus tyrosinisolvens TaxID=1443435 RepID=UPI00063F139E|nr:hypothetical protein [Aneurinibacillus tyrosinisolvens]
MDAFTYEGMVFKPLRKLVGKESDFSSISNRLNNIGLTPANWNYERFYQIAKAAQADDYDLFEINGKVVIPSLNYLFEYR